MFSSPAFWLLLLTAIVIDATLILAWRRRRGLSIRPKDLWEDSWAAPGALTEGIKRHIYERQWPSWQTPRLPSFQFTPVTLPRLSLRSPGRWLWQFVVPVGLVSLPVWLVLRDRWFRVASGFDALRRITCTVETFCNLQLPPYFPLVLGALGALFFMTRIASQENVTLNDLGLLEVGLPEDSAPTPVSTRQYRWAHALVFVSLLALIIVATRALRFDDGQPGVEYAVLFLSLLIAFILREVPLAQIGQGLRHLWPRPLSVVFSHLALVWLLASLYDTRRAPWLALVVTGLAYANVWRFRKQVSPVFWIVTGALLVYTLYINAWWTSIVGDDYAFLNDAMLVLDQPWQSTADQVFRGAFTYGSHPYLTNILQAAFLKVFGMNNFAWRFSSIYVAVMSLPFFYGFLKCFVQQRLALVITVLLAGSHYLIAFSRIGYNNMQALFTTGMMLYLAAAALRSSGLRSYAVLGAVMGLSFYAFPGALLALPLPLVLLLIYKKLPTTGHAFAQWGTAAAAALLLITPLIFQPIYWTSKLPGSFLTSAVSANTSPAFHWFSNTVYAFLSPLFFIEESHFVVVGFVDVFSAGLFYLGVCFVAWRWRGQRFLVFMLCSYLFMLLTVGIIHNYLTPPATRMFMLLPWFVFFSGVGVIWIAEQVRRLGFSSEAMRALMGVGVVFLLGVNVYQGYRLSFERSPRYHNFISMLLGVTNDFFSQPENAERRILVMNDSGSLHMPNFWRMLDLYQVPVDETNFQAVRVYGNLDHLDIVPYDEAVEQFADPQALIMVNPSLAGRAPTLLAEYETYLQSIGKQRCDVMSYSGHVRFWFWYSLELEASCPPGL